MLRGPTLIAITAPPVDGLAAVFPSVMMLDHVIVCQTEHAAGSAMAVLVLSLLGQH